MLFCVVVIMANEKNLIPFSERTKDEARELGAKGGQNSGAARRRKKTMKQCMELLLSLNATSEADWNTVVAAGITLNDLAPDEITNIMVINAALVNNAKLGDVNSIKELRSIIRDDERLKHEQERIKIEQEKLKLLKEKSSDTEALDKLDDILGRLTEGDV